MKKHFLLLSATVVFLCGEAFGKGQNWIRINQLGYLPSSKKVAVLCSNEAKEFQTFTVLNEAKQLVFGPKESKNAGPFGSFKATYRLDFSALQNEGTYYLESDGTLSQPFRISETVYSGAADTLLYYMRQQRSGFNPFFKDSCHTKDGNIVYHPQKEGQHLDVAGGWHDASDYLQYGTTSANATFCMLMAYRDQPWAFRDAFQANGLEGENGVPDILDEARWGLEWLLKMFPVDDELYHQIADDRDHTYWDLPTSDSSDYGWGQGGPRPIYLATGKPQGLFQYQNRSTGIASIAGKYASAFALGAKMFRVIDSSFSKTLQQKAIAAYALGKKYPGVCQTVPCRSPYFYEEENWVDDMELAAIELFGLTSREEYLQDARSFAQQEPVTPWMGRDTARHYQYYPWHNAGHYEIGKAGTSEDKATMAEFYRRGIEAVARRADNGFMIGIPFIWCSNNLVTSFATQCLLYRKLTKDSTYIELEAAARDWLFGCNPWSVSMVIGLPEKRNYARNPHSVISQKLKVQLTGGLLDGPVYTTIYNNLKGIRLWDDDEYAQFNTGFIVYHDDIGDYSTNEPIMDGTASLTYLLSALTTGE